MLTNTQLLELNSAMLNLGAPVAIDGQGYNQVDFSIMYKFSTYSESELSNTDRYKIAYALSKYKNTQLTSYIKELEDTVNKLYSTLKSVTIIDISTKEVSLNWNFNQNISNFIKAMDRTTYSWKKTSLWILNIGWDNINELLDTFEQNGYEISNLREYKAKLESGEITDDVKENLDTHMNNDTPIKVHVTRNSKAIDTLSLQMQYNKHLIEAVGKVPGTYYSSDSKVWSFYIENSGDVYIALKNTGVNADLSDLEPWKTLVDSWKVDYPMKEVPNCLPFTPYEFQIKDIEQLLKGHHMINGNDMGCGKTFEDIMVGYSIPLPKLVICPATLRLNWMYEIQMIDPNADITILYSDSEFSTSEWTIIGYSSIDKHLKDLEKSNFQVLLIDEAHYCQAINNSGNPDSKRAKAVLRLAATAGWVLPTTGTPKTNRNKNLFNTLRMIRHPLTRGKWAFQNYGVTYCEGQDTGWGWDYNGNSNDEELHDLIKPYMVRHLKSEVLPHLKKARRIIPVSVDLREYNAEIADYLNSRTNKEAEQLARLMRARVILATQKVGETIDFAKEIMSDGDKVVLVTCFTEVVSVLEKAFKDKCVKIVGGMSDVAKQSAKDNFQTGSAQVIILNIVAGGVGITLTASHNLIINDLPWTIGDIVQVEDRICRSGQTAEFSNIYYMTAKGADVEEEMVDLLTYKSETINTVVDGGCGDSIDFRSLVQKRRNNGIVRRLEHKCDSQNASDIASIKSSNSTTSMNFTGMSIDELEKYANDNGIQFKTYNDPKIHRMRIVMTIKKSMV